MKVKVILSFSKTKKLTLFKILFTATLPQKSACFHFMSLQDKFIGKKLQVTLDDNRVVKGFMECVDSDRNMILGETTQIQNQAGEKNEVYLGYVMLPGDHVRKVEIIMTM